MNIFYSEIDSIDVRACQSYFWALNNETYFESGIHLVDTTNELGCDLKAYLNLEIYNEIILEQVENSCSDFFWDYNNQTYQYSGNYQTTIGGGSSCDTLINLTLSVLESNFHIPNTFTPNLDRKNEIFKITNTLQHFYQISKC